MHVVGSDVMSCTNEKMWPLEARGVLFEFGIRYLNKAAQEFSRRYLDLEHVENIAIQPKQQSQRIAGPLCRYDGG